RGDDGRSRIACGATHRARGRRAACTGTSTRTRGSSRRNRARGPRAEPHRRAPRRTGCPRRLGIWRSRPWWSRCDAAGAWGRGVGAGAPRMPPLRFEQLYQDEWAELEALLNGIRGRKGGTPETSTSGARAAALYRRACEQLALARARSYPAYIVDRLERMTATA